MPETPRQILIIYWASTMAFGRDSHDVPLGIYIILLNLFRALHDIYIIIVIIIIIITTIIIIIIMIIIIIIVILRMITMKISMMMIFTIRIMIVAHGSSQNDS